MQSARNVGVPRGNSRGALRGAVPRISTGTAGRRCRTLPGAGMMDRASHSNDPIGDRGAMGSFAEYRQISAGEESGAVARKSRAGTT